MRHDFADDIMFSHKRANGPESDHEVYTWSKYRWQHFAASKNSALSYVVVVCIGSVFSQRVDRGGGKRLIDDVSSLLITCQSAEAGSQEPCTPAGRPGGVTPTVRRHADDCN